MYVTSTILLSYFFLLKTKAKNFSKDPRSTNYAQTVLPQRTVKRGLGNKFPPFSTGCSTFTTTH